MPRILIVSCCVLMAAALPAGAADPVRVMILDGEQGGPYHAWQETTPYLKKMLEETKLFQVEVVTAPPAGGDFANWQVHPKIEELKSAARKAGLWNMFLPDPHDAVSAVDALALSTVVDEFPVAEDGDFSRGTGSRQYSDEL